MLLDTEGPSGCHWTFPVCRRSVGRSGKIPQAPKSSWFPCRALRAGSWEPHTEKCCFQYLWAASWPFRRLDGSKTPRGGLGVRFLWRRLLLRNQSQCKHLGTEMPLQGVSPSDLTWVEVAQPPKCRPDTQIPWKRASNPAGVRGKGREGALCAAPSSIMCGTAPVRHRVCCPGPGPLGRAPDSAVPGAVLREQPGSPRRAIVPRLSANASSSGRSLSWCWGQEQPACVTLSFVLFVFCCFGMF